MGNWNTWTQKLANEIASRYEWLHSATLIADFASSLEATIDELRKENDVLRQSLPPVFDWSRVINRCAEVYGVLVEEIEGESRLWLICRARQVAMVIGVKSGLSTSAVGLRFKRCHSTVVHAGASIAAALACDTPTERQKIEQLFKEFGVSTDKD